MGSHENPDTASNNKGKGKGNSERTEEQGSSSNTQQQEKDDGDDGGSEPSESDSNYDSSDDDMPGITKYPKPPSFNGEATFFRGWMAALELYYKSVGESDNAKRINYALGLLQNKAEDWQRDYITRHAADETQQSWRAFKDALEQAFAPAQLRHEAEERLQSYRQTGRYIEEYISGFSVLASQANITDDTALSSYFARGLDPTVRIEAIRQRPTTIDEWKRAARTAYQIIVEQQKILVRPTSQRYHSQNNSRQTRFPQRTFSKHFSSNPRYIDIRSVPLQRNTRSEWDMDIDNLEYTINNLTLDDQENNNDFGEPSIEDNYPEDQESDNEELNYINQKGRKSHTGYSNSSRSSNTNIADLNEFINNILTDDQKKALKNKECFYCRKTGHWARNCPAKKNRPANFPRNSAAKNFNSKSKNFRRPQRQNNQRFSRPPGYLLNIEEDEEEPSDNEEVINF